MRFEHPKQEDEDYYAHPDDNILYVMQKTSGRK